MPDESSGEVFVSSAPTAQAIYMAAIGLPLPDGVNVNYATFDRNEPKKFGNQFFVWESANSTVPWSRDPIAKVPLATNSYSGTQKVGFDYEPQTGYIIGYGLSPDPGSVCATFFIPPNAPPGDTMNLTVGSPVWGRGFVQIKYNALANYNPSENGNLIGLWNAPQASYDGDALAVAPVPYSQSSGPASIMYDILANTTYTVGYFMGGNTALAGQVTFSTG